MQERPAAIPAFRGTRYATRDADVREMARRLEFALIAALMALPTVLWLASSLIQ